jgi:hypothetical protein
MRMTLIKQPIFGERARKLALGAMFVFLSVVTVFAGSADRFTSEPDVDRLGADYANIEVWGSGGPGGMANSICRDHCYAERSVWHTPLSTPAVQLQLMRAAS